MRVPPVPVVVVGVVGVLAKVTGALETRLYANVGSDDSSVLFQYVSPSVSVETREPIQAKTSSVTCDDESRLEGCRCEGKPIGRKSTGEFGQDVVLASKFTPPAPQVSSFWNLTAFQYGQELPLQSFHAKAAIVVNIASAWGLTNSFYKAAAALLKRYQARGLQLIAVPVNQFGHQAPHSAPCERAFMYKKMGMDTFPVLDKVLANGDQEAPFYTYLKQQSPGDLAWNYEKFLVDGAGHVVGRFASSSPLADAEPKIVELLNA